MHKGEPSAEPPHRPGSSALPVKPAAAGKEKNKYSAIYDNCAAVKLVFPNVSEKFSKSHKHKGLTFQNENRVHQKLQGIRNQY